jgi:anaphase-promoting complex subunit 10
LVNIQFRRKTTIKEIYVYTDYKLDESYTPNRISIRAGTNFNDLQEIEVVDLKEPVGWVKIPLKDMHDHPIRTFMIQVAVISNHQNGRDTHMRQIKVHSPIDEFNIMCFVKLYAVSLCSPCRGKSLLVPSFVHQSHKKLEKYVQYLPRQRY